MSYPKLGRVPLPQRLEMLGQANLASPVHLHGFALPQQSQSHRNKHTSLRLLRASFTGSNGNSIPPAQANKSPDSPLGSRRGCQSASRTRTAGPCRTPNTDHATYATPKHEQAISTAQHFQAPLAVRVCSPRPDPVLRFDVKPVVVVLLVHLYKVDERRVLLSQALQPSVSVTRACSRCHPSGVCRMSLLAHAQLEG